MQEPPSRWRAAWIAAEQAVSSIPPQTQPTLGLFSTRLLRISHGREDMLRQLDQIKETPPKLSQKERKTALLGTFLQLLDQGALHSGDVIFIVTDGGEDTALSKDRQVLARMNSAGVRLFALVISMELDTPEERFGPDWLKRFAAATGGEVSVFDPGHLLDPSQWSAWNADFTRRIQLLNRQLFLHLSPYYEITIELPEQITKPEKWKPLLLKAEMQKSTLLYPQQLLPCATRP